MTCRGDDSLTSWIFCLRAIIESTGPRKYRSFWITNKPLLKKRKGLSYSNTQKRVRRNKILLPQLYIVTQWCKDRLFLSDKFFQDQFEPLNWNASHPLIIASFYDFNFGLWKEEVRIPTRKLAGVAWSGELRVNDNVRLCVRKLTFIKLTFKINFERQ